MQGSTRMMELQQCHGQVGGQAKIKEVSPKALYTNYNNHRLHLSIAAVRKILQDSASVLCHRCRQWGFLLLHASKEGLLLGKSMARSKQKGCSAVCIAQDGWNDTQHWIRFMTCTTICASAWRLWMHPMNTSTATYKLMSAVVLVTYLTCSPLSSRWSWDDDA